MGTTTTNAPTPTYGELTAGQVVRPRPGTPMMLVCDPERTGPTTMRLTFTTGATLDVDPTDTPMDLVTHYDYRIDSDTPVTDENPEGGPVWCAVHPDDLEETLGRHLTWGHRNIVAQLRAVDPDAYRVMYGNR